MEFIKPFSELSKRDANIAGGKGASLGEMAQSGIPVPDGFVVLSSTFDHFLNETDLAQEVESILKSVDHKAIHTVESASEKIRGLIEAQEVPEDIANEVVEAFKTLKAEFVAVRSSATAEDGADHAWAGQLDSFLNTTEVNLLENMRKCWSSLFTPRAIFYRFEKELNLTEISVAVVVQKMIQSEVSGIAFSVHPITEDRNQLIIEAGYGLGEAIVSGSITPDSYVVEKEPLRIIDINTSTQTKSLIRSETKSGAERNRWVGIQKSEGEKQKLSEEQILELAKLVIKIENHYGFPCDIEWAYENGKFYITQSRPITTLSNKPFVREFKKFFTRDISLVMMEYWWEGEYLSFNKLLNEATRFNPLFIKTGNQTNVYYDVNNPDTAIKPLFDFYIEHPDKFENNAKKFKENYNKLEKFAENYEKANLKDFYETFVDFWGFLPVIVQLGNSLNENLPQIIKEKAYKLRELSQAGEYTLGNAFVNAIKFQYPEFAEYADVVSIKELLSSSPVDKEVLKNRKNGFIFFENQLITGKNMEEFQKENNILINDSLSIIGEYSKKNKPLYKKNVSRDACMATIEFWEKSDTQYLKDWIGVTTERLVYERSKGVLTVYENEQIFTDATKAIKERLEMHGWVEDIIQKYTENLKEIEILKERLTTEPNKGNLEAYFEKLARTQSIFALIYFVPVIEDAPTEAKELCMEQRKLTENFFYNANAVFEEVIPKVVPPYAVPYAKVLSIYEILGELPSEAELKKRGEHFIFYDHKFRYDVTLDDIESELNILIEKEESVGEVDTLKGNIAFKGKVQGKVSIVLTKSDLAKVEEGDVMVTPMTNPDFITAMERASAFVTDEGGVTSHAAITAREMNKPCIIGTKVATKVFKDGDIVEVDADNGIVRIIK